MKINKLTLKNAYVLEPEPFADHRGKFIRIYCYKELQRIGHSKPIVQINHSISIQKGTVRGMHFQYRPKAETKIVKCVCGSVFDVIIDLRRGSSTFLQWHGEVLSAENMKMMYVPEGFAHGFQTLEEDAELLYLDTEFYSPGHEGGVRFDDPAVGIKWPIPVSQLSEKDSAHPLLSSDFSGIVL